MASKKTSAKSTKKAPPRSAKAGSAKAVAKKPPPPKPAPKAKAATKPAAKPAAPSKGAKPAPKIPPKAATPVVKPPPRKKLNVGQKPRSERADLPLKPQSLASMGGEMAAAGVKPSPASKEAKQTFRVNDHVVYPAHGVGRIVGIEKQHIAGVTNELFVIDFEQEKMKLRVPTAKAISVGMRGLADEALVKKAIDVLKGRARIKRTMWSRRAQEYEAKINSGDIIAVAEVVRDLYRATDQPEQSYSERQLFEAAQDRLAREVAAVRKTDLAQALAALDHSLQQKKAA